MQASNPSANPKNNPPRELHEIYLPSEAKITQHIKKNPRTTTKFNIDLFLSSYSGRLPMQPLPSTIKLFKKATFMLQQEKLTSSLIFSAHPLTASESTLTVFKLKYLKNLTSLSLESLSNCTPGFLQFLSMTLGHLKKLDTLSIAFPKDAKFSPQHFTSFFFALKRLNNLKSLSLKFFEARFDDQSCQALILCLSKLPQLKSLTLNFTYPQVLNPDFLSILAPAFKKLTLLESLDISFNCPKSSGPIESQTFSNFFESIKDLKFFNSLAFNLRGCNVPTTASSAILQGLDNLNLKTLSLIFYSSIADEFLVPFGTTLQKFTCLGNLRLDFPAIGLASDAGLAQFASSLQTLQSLSSLHLVFPGVEKLKTSVKTIGTALKPLINLRSLNLDFTRQTTTDDLQFIAFSDGLQGLTALDSLVLKFGQLKNIKDDGLIAFSTALKSMTNLTTLNLELSYMELLSNKGFISLFSSIGYLNKLTDLSLNCLGNKNIDEKGLEILGETLQNLSFLTAVSLNVIFCSALKGGGEKFLAIFKALNDMKFLRKIRMNLPSKDCNGKAYELCTKHVPDQTVFWM